MWNSTFWIHFLLVCVSSLGIEGNICTGSGTNRVHLTALLELNPTSTCDSKAAVDPFTLSLALATEYILDQVNSGRTDLGVPGVTYGLEIENICGNRSLAVRQTALNIPLSVWKEKQICLGNSPANDVQDSLLLGFLGPSLSYSTVHVGEYLSDTRIPQIAPSATLAQLSDKTKYHSLLRTATSDAKQSKAIVDVAIEMGWSYALLAFTNDAYGIQGAADVEEYGRSKGLCFSRKIQVEINPANRKEYYRNISRDFLLDAAEGIIYFGQGATAEDFLDLYLNDLTISSKRKVFLASDGIGSSTDVLSRFARSHKPSKPELISIIPYSTANAALTDYVSKRLQGVKNGSQSINSLLSAFKSKCASTNTCELEKATDFTLQIMEATVSFLNAFKIGHGKICGNESGVCEALSDSPHFYSLLLNTLQKSEVNTEVNGQTIRLTYGLNGDIHGTRGQPAYLLGYIKGDRFDVIGQYHHNYTWTYHTDITSLLPSGGIYRCRAHCDRCIQKRPPYVYRRGQSDFIIGFSTPASEGADSHGCGNDVTLNGFVMMESFYFAVQQIKQITGIDFSTLFIDTCYAKLGTHGILNDIFVSENRAVLKDSRGREYEVSPSDFVVFFGDASSGLSIVLQTYFSLYNIPQISYRSTSTWLSDRLRYPTFMRNVPSDEQQARLMIEIIRKNRWNNIGLIHSQTVYGQTGAELLKKYAKNNEICISFLKSATERDDDLKQLALDIRDTAARNALPRPIIVFAEEQFIKTLLLKIKLHDGEWKERGNIIIAGETWSTNPNIIRGIEEFTYGTLTFSFSDETFSWSADGNNYFQKFLHDEKPTANSDNPAFIKFWQQYFDCYLPNNYFPAGNKLCDINSQSLAQERTGEGSLDLEDVVGKHIVMAGLSVAYAIREGIDGEEICSRLSQDIDCSKLFKTTKGRDRFFQLLQETKIPRAINSKTKVYSPFLPSGDGRINYKVYNIIRLAGKTHYNPVYTVTDGELIEIETPTYYIGGDIDKNEVVSMCPSAQCSCTESNELGQSATVTESTTTLSDQSASPKWMLPLLILIFICLLALLVIAVTHIVCMHRAKKHSSDDSYEKTLLGYPNHGVDHIGFTEHPPPPVPPVAARPSLNNRFGSLAQPNSYNGESHANNSAEERDPPDGSKQSKENLSSIRDPAINNPSGANGEAILSSRESHQYQYLDMSRHPSSRLGKPLELDETKTAQRHLNNDDEGCTSSSIVRSSNAQAIEMKTVD